MFNIKSKITQKLLGYYLLNREAEHYLNELAKILSVDPGNLDRKLKELEKEGIFASRSIGNQRHYSLNKEYPLLDELKKFFDLNYGLENKLSESLKKIKGLKEAYIFGSYARADFGPDSDIDILLVGNHSSIEVQRLLARLEGAYKKEFNAIDMTAKELEEKKKSGDEFVINIFSNKIIQLV